MPPALNDDEILLITDQQYRSSSLEKKRDQLICHLQSQGLTVGDHIVVMTHNQTSIFIITAACFQAGFVLVCLDPSTGPNKISTIVTTVNPKALLADNAILSELSSVSIPLPKVCIDTNPEAPKRQWLPKRKHSNWTTIYSIFKTLQITNDHINTQTKAKNIRDELPAYILYTSGSTNKPKGVVVSRGALKKHVHTLSNQFHYSCKSKLLCFLPAHHTDGLVHGCYVPILTGMSVIRPGIFKLTTDFQKIGLSQGATHFLAVPTILSIILEYYGDDSELFTKNGLTTIISTAGVLDENLWRRFESAFKVRLFNFYGLTETISGALYCSKHNYRTGTVGKPVGVETRLISNNQIVEIQNSPGELQLRGDQLMDGYLVGGKLHHHHGRENWFNTGDIFTQDSEGFYYFKGRVKEIIKKGGVTIYPQDICQHIQSLDGVIDCEIIGYPDPVFEELIVACFVTAMDISTSKLKQHCANCLPEEMLPDHYLNLTALPRNKMGKLSRPQLLNTIQKHLNSSLKPVIGKVGRKDEIEEGVLNVAASVFKSEDAVLHIDMNKNQISGWDSYAHLNFIKQIEKTYSIRLKARDIMQIDSLSDAVKFVKNSISQPTTTKNHTLT